MNHQAQASQSIETTLLTLNKPTYNTHESVKKEDMHQQATTDHRNATFSSYNIHWACKNPLIKTRL
jgi:hypothetical protein